MAAFLSEADDHLTSCLLDLVLFDEPLQDGRKTGKMNQNSRDLRLRKGELDEMRDVVLEVSRSEEG
jgi:hypothetical protein